ncbi:MAG: non-heme iron oxygenase ferredoxin subunit [Stellaceae bacterium]
MSTWHWACRASEVQEGEPLGVRLGGLAVGLFRVGERLLAVHDICSHEYALLSKGYQEGGIVECPLHQARFELATGRCLGPPAERDIRVFELRVEGDEVSVNLPEGQTDQTLTRSGG